MMNETDKKVEEPLWRRLSPLTVSLIENAIKEGLIKEKEFNQ